MFNNRAEARQRFSLRKLTVGVVSVLLGLTFLTYNGENVHADTNSASAQPKTEEVSSSSSKGDIDKESTVDSNNVKQEKTPVESTNVKTKNAAPKAEVKSSAAQVADKVLKTQDVSKTEDKTSNSTEQKKTGDKENTVISNETGIYIGHKAYQIGKQYITKEADEDAKRLTAQAEANYAKLSQDQKNNPDSWHVQINPQIPKEIVAKYFGLNKSDIPESQLEKLGLAKDTFFVHDANGKVEKVKLGNIDLIVLSWDGRQKFQFEAPAIHEADGFVHFFEPDYKANPDPINQGYYIGDSFQIVESGPITEGKQIYINVNHTLDSNDANRAIENGQPDAYGTGSHWITGEFDNTKAGDYEGHFEAFYKNGVGILTGIPITVVDLQGQTVTGTLGKDIDEKVAKVIQNPAKYIDGIPAGSTRVTLLEKPSRTQSSDVNAIVTYPDGNSGVATIHVIVKASTPGQPTTPGNQPTAPTSPAQPTNQPSQPTNVPPHPENPTKPVEPTKPNQPSNVRPKPVKPIRPAKPQSSNVKPKPVKPAKARTTKPIAQNGKKNDHHYGYRYVPKATNSKSYSGVSNASALKACNKVLPHTGNKGSGVIAAIGAAFAAVAGFFGLAGRRRKRF